MELAKVSKNIANRVQERLNNLTVDEPPNVLIEEEIKESTKAPTKVAKALKKISNKIITHFKENLNEI